MEGGGGGRNGTRRERLNTMLIDVTLSNWERQVERSSAGGKCVGLVSLSVSSREKRKGDRTSHQRVEVFFFWKNTDEVAEVELPELQIFVL